MEKHSGAYDRWICRIESASRNPKRLMIVRGMLFNNWYMDKFYVGEQQKLINMIDDYLKGELGW